MITRVVEVRALAPYRLWLRFDDGATGEYDLAEHVAFEGMFAPLRDAAYFIQVFVDDHAGTVAWPNGLDLDPIVLHSRVTGGPLPA